MAGEAVGSSAERGVARGGSVERAVDVRLEVLDAHAHRKGLALHGHPVLAQQRKDVARGVAAGEDHAVRGDELLAHESVFAHGGERDASDGAARYVEVAHAAARTNLSSCLLDLAHDLGHNAGEHVAADVGLGVPEDLGLSSRCDEGLQDEAVRGALGAGLELAVREGARPANAKLDVALYVELAGLVVVAHGLGTPCGVLTALDEQGLQPGAGERERTEEPGAARAHDDGPAPNTRDGSGEGEGPLVHELDALDGAHVGARGELGAKRERELDVPLFPGVNRATAALHAQKAPLAHVQLARKRSTALRQLAFVAAVEGLEGDANAGDLDHGIPIFLECAQKSFCTLK